MDSHSKKKDYVIQGLSACFSAEKRYKWIIHFGQILPPMNSAYKVPKNLVKECQSDLYLHGHKSHDELLHFEADSSSLISKGLAAILVTIYSGEYPEIILRHPPTFLSDLNLLPTLSIARIQGVHAIYKNIQKKTLQLLI